MINQADVIPILLEACPTFENTWQEHVQDYGEDLLYVAAGAFARHLLGLKNEGDLSCLPSVGAAIERFHQEGSPWVKEFATIGLLEGIQNVWSHQESDGEYFSRYLGEESMRWWQSLNTFWSGEKTHVSL
ncbi:DUF7674 family protein [Undibacterium terreum]|nr:hypothetical protein [Undibacterium terreum]